MSIISTTQLTAELPTSPVPVAGIVTNAVNRASDLVNTWATHYEIFPESTAIPAPPYQVQQITVEIAKALYWMGMGQIYRDGQEQESWQAVLNRYEKSLGVIEIPPTGQSKTIALNSDGIMLIARNQHILRWHPDLCYVTSTAHATTTMWNQGFHWDIRKGNDGDTEFLDGWYFDAEQYMATIEGTLYYARSWRNDSQDYLRYGRRAMSMATANQFGENVNDLAA